MNNTSGPLFGRLKTALDKHSPFHSLDSIDKIQLPLKSLMQDLIQHCTQAKYDQHQCIDTRQREIQSRHPRSETCCTLQSGVMA